MAASYTWWLLTFPLLHSQWCGIFVFANTEEAQLTLLLLDKWNSNFLRSMFQSHWGDALIQQKILNFPDSKLKLILSLKLHVSLLPSVTVSHFLYITAYENVSCCYALLNSSLWPSLLFSAWKCDIAYYRNKKIWKQTKNLRIIYGKRQRWVSVPWICSSSTFCKAKILHRTIFFVCGLPQTNEAMITAACRRVLIYCASL